MIGEAQVEMARKQVDMARRQMDASLLASGATTTLTIRAQLNGQEFRNTRAEAAKGLLNRKRSGSAVMTLLNEFEFVGMLLEKGALDEEIIWSTCSDWILHYYPAVRSTIGSDVEDNPTYWEYFIKLHGRMAAMEKKKGGKDVDPPYEQWNAFLESEAGERARPEGAAPSGQERPV